MTVEEARQHISQIRREWFGLDDPLHTPGENPLLAMLGRALNQLATGIFEHTHHYVFELTQNADDNHYHEGSDRFLKFVLLEDDPTGTPGSKGCLCVLNDETGFERKHVESLCNIGNSTKKGDREGYIGEKGIGFKSVFLISDRPHIISNGYSFHYRRDDCDAELGYIVPHWNEQVPAVAENSPTVILLPLRSASGVDVAQQLADVEPECILFLRKLHRIELVAGKISLRRSVQRSGAEGFVDLDSGGARSSYFVHRAVYPCGQIQEERRQGVVSTPVTIALPLTGLETADGRVFAFLPTEARTGFPFLINADFLMPASRERILDTPEWNKQLVGFAAATFVEAFDKLLGNAKYQTFAYRFIPTKADLMQGASLFAPLVEAVQGTLQRKECILTETGDFVLPRDACFAGSGSRRLLSEAPPKLTNFRMVHSDLEVHRKRLEPLGVPTLTFIQLFAACNDHEWLIGRNADWWEALWELCAKCDVSARTVGSFPILRCRDGICRPLSSCIFSNAEDQSTPTGIPSDWPAAHLLDADLQKRVQLKPVVWAWLKKVAGLRPFAIQSYITTRLLDWMRQQTGEHLIEATRFISANFKHLDTSTRQTLREKMTWLIADGKALHSEARFGREIITPECLENDIGWNLLFSALDRHFLVIHDDYCAGLSGDSLLELREMFKACGATAFPNPRFREMNPGEPHYTEALARCAHAFPGTPKLRDWAAPGWLLGLEGVEQIGNGQRKVEALERWLNALGPDYVKKLLHCAKPDFQGDWQQLNAWSEFGGALHKKPWLRTSRGYVTPPTAFLRTPELVEFFGDSLSYVAADIATPLLEKLGVRVHLTAELLISRLREMSGCENPDLVLLAKIYRHLQDPPFDVNLFRREKLIFLSKPKPRWLSTERLVWDNAGELFDDDFGYVSLTYGKSELHRFFTEKLKIPAQPELRHYANAWKNLWLATSPDRHTAERKLKIILLRLADNKNDLSDSDWWRELKPQLRFWTDRGEFLPPARVYVPNHSTAVELFAGRIHIAFPPKPSRTVLEFLRSMDCRSLAAAVQTKLVGAAGECERLTPVFLTPAAKELCVLLVCSHHGWEGRCSHLQALRETAEIVVKEITVEYRLKYNHEVGARLLQRDAHWDIVGRRLLLRDGVDAESLRYAAANSIAAEFFGEAASPELQAEFFYVLTVALERARKLMRERSNWRLTLQQQAWLLEQSWHILIIELDEAEQPPVPRTPTGPTSPSVNTSSPVAAISKSSSANSEPAAAQGTGSEANQGVLAPSEQRNQETPHSDTRKTHQEQKPPIQPVSDAVPELHDANTTIAEFVKVRAHTRSAPQRFRGEQTNETRREAVSGLSSVSADTKKALETEGRKFAANELRKMGYEVEPMGQQNPGFDLRAIKPGHILKVEVKSHAREASSVFVTQREREEYLTMIGVNGETWELWNVENVAKSSGKTPTIQRIGHIPESAWKESGYWVDLSQCSQEQPK